MSKSNAKQKKDVLVQKSPAEFFAENKNIAGFDNPGKCLYTTIRELVENALDSAESIRELPNISLTIEELSLQSLNKLRGVDNHTRVNEQLYHDYESEEARKKRLAKEAQQQEKIQKLLQKGDPGSAAEARKLQAEIKRAAGPKGNMYYKVTVQDNGSGMPHKEIPNMLGRVLSGTKYGVKQTRGKFGLGAKMALIWSKMTTGLPFEIFSVNCKAMSTRSHYILDIDIHKNEPRVHKEESLPNSDHAHTHGAQLSLTILGNWGTYKAKVFKYLRQIAVITPYAEFTFIYKSESDDKNNLALKFCRRTDVMPPVPKEVRHHPSSVDLELVKRLAKTSGAKDVASFLTREFSCISKDHAARLVEELRKGLDPECPPGDLEDRQVVLLHQLLHQARFDDPKGDHLSPAGEYNLRLGVMKELHPDLIATYQGDVRVFEGHAFLVEAAVSVGGRDIKPGINVYLFANRIPLLFEGGSDVITKTALKRMAWNSYKINQSSDRVGVFVSIVSTKIPFKGAGKEYIGDDVEEMVAAVKQALQACCLQLKVKIARQQAAREQAQRKRNLAKYIPNTVSALWGVLKHMAENPAQGPKRRRLDLEHSVTREVRSGSVTQSQLITKLTEHVERIDTDLALEYQMSQGLVAGSTREDLALAPRTARCDYGAELHANVAVFKLLRLPVQ